MKQLSVLIKPASSLCNMRCFYCFYADVAENRALPSYGLMSEETARGILLSLRKDLKAGDELTIAFQGGEPTLAGPGFFRRFFEMTDEILPDVRMHWAFQTNGLLLDEEWCALLRDRDVLVGISIDGNASMHNQNRLDAAKKGTYNRVRRSMEMLRKTGVSFNVLTVLTPEMARHPQAVFNWLLAEHIDYVQFIPCLSALNAEKASPYTLRPADFKAFYEGIFPLWERAVREGRYVSIKLFEDLVNLYLGHRATSCGILGKCAVQFAVEANGDVFPCDFYVLDEYRMGSLTEKPPSDLLPEGEVFLMAGRGYEQEEPCKSCHYLSSCGGGCKRMKDSMYIEGGVCHYAELLDEILGPLLRAAGRILNGRR